MSKTSFFIRIFIFINFFIYNLNYKFHKINNQINLNCEFKRKMNFDREDDP